MSEMENKNFKVCFAASSGGHLEQLLMLMPLMKKYDSFIVTEKTKYEAAINNLETYYLFQINRKEKMCLIKLVGNVFLSLRIILREKPDVVICTGVLAMVPLCLICKLLRKRLIYIESFAKVKTPTMSGKLLYKFADRFYIQWPQLKRIYPKAIYLGQIY